MGRRAPSSTRTDTLCPYTTLFRSGRLDVAGQLRQGQDLDRAARTLALRAGAAVHHRGDGAAPGDRRRIRWRAEVQARQAGRHVRALARREGKRMRSEEHTSELQSLMRISYAVFCLKKKNKHHNTRMQQKQFN